MTTEQTRQLVEQLAKRFSDVLSTALQEAIAGAVEKVKEEFEETRRREFEKLFDTQLETLKGRGVPQMIIDGFWKQKSEVVKKAMGITIRQGHIAFIPVIILPGEGLYYLMQMLGGFSTDLNPSFLSDVVGVPKDFYYIYDVASGVNLSRWLSDAEEAIKEQNQSPLTLAESIALKIHSEELAKINMISLGSRYGKRVPFIYRDIQSYTLMALEMDTPLDRWEELAIPSCGSRG
jgi:hypothetical protein